MSAESPPKPGRRSARRAETTERFIEAALDALARDGVEGLTVQRLAADTGHSLGALYRYFASKEALLIAVQQRVVDALDQDLAKVLTSIEHDVTRHPEVGGGALCLLRLVAAGLCYESLVRRRPSHVALISLSLADPRQMVDNATAALILPSLLALLGRVTGLLEGAQHMGALSPGDSGRRTLLLWSTVHGLLQLRKLARFGLDPAALTEEAISGLLLSWGAQAGQLAVVQSLAGPLVAQALGPQEG